MNFSDLQIENKLKKSIELAEFKTPTPIQSQSIPVSLTGCLYLFTPIASNSNYQHVDIVN